MSTQTSPSRSCVDALQVDQFEARSKLMCFHRMQCEPLLTLQRDKTHSSIRAFEGTTEANYDM